MENRVYLQVPGPTNVPDRILRALSKPLINHRGEEFETMLGNINAKLKEILFTNNDVLMFPSSGSGVLESAIVNLFSKGDTIAAVSLGVFSERMAQIAEAFGLEVIRIEKPWGEAVALEDIQRVFAQDKEHKIKALCLPQNETATGIVNDIAGVSRLMKQLNHPALLVVDAISSAGCMELKTNDWEIDVLLTASQKGFMLPPGIGIAVVGSRGWEAAKHSDLPKWYWNYFAVRDKLKENQFPYTPATSLLFGLEEAVEILLEEGMDQVWARHQNNAAQVRDKIKDLGLKLMAEDSWASNTVTAVYMPEGIAYKDLAKLMKDKYHIVIAGGLGKLQGQVFRIGHLGMLDQKDLMGILGSLEASLVELGYKIP